VDNFKYQVIKLSGVNPSKVQEEIKQATRQEQVKQEISKNGVNNEGFVGTQVNGFIFFFIYHLTI
jgi:hypothetical protein